jgi:hypothetical protein
MSQMNFTVKAEGTVTLDTEKSPEQLANLTEALTGLGVLAALKTSISAENAENALIEMAREAENLQKKVANLAARPPAKQGFFAKLCSPRIPLDSEEHKKQKVDALVLCQMRHDRESLVHNLVFKSLYKLLTGYDFSENSRWSKIGLSDNGDFNNDLDGNVGMMGGLQALYLMEKYPTFAKKLYGVATDEKTKFQMVRILTLISSTVYDAFIAGDLNRLIIHTRAQTVMRGILIFYCASVFKFDRLWSAKKYAFEHMHPSIEQAVKSCAKDPVGKVSKYLDLMKE